MKLIILSIIVIIATFFLWKKLYVGIHIKLKPKFPIYLARECKPGKVLLQAEEAGEEVVLETKILGKQGEGFCAVEYEEEVSPGNIYRYSYLYNEKGYLCTYEAPGFEITLPNLFCRFISLL